jgi:hypothetical protein
VIAVRSHSILLSLALAVVAHFVAATKAVPEAANTAATAGASLQAGTSNGTTGSGAVDEERNLFVGMGGMRNLPGLPEVGGGYGQGSGRIGTGVFTALPGLLGVVWGSIGSNRTVRCVGGGSGVSFGGFGCRDTSFSCCPQRRVQPRRCHAMS